MIIYFYFLFSLLSSLNTIQDSGMQRNVCHIIKKKKKELVESFKALGLGVGVGVGLVCTL